MSEGSPVDDATWIALQRFLHREAACLDRRAFAEWQELLAEDIVYRVLARVTRDAAEAAIEYAIIDDNAVSLRARVGQLANPRFTRAENPPSLTRRFVSNVEASQGERPDEYLVASNLLIHRSKGNLPEGGLYAGERRDVLRRSGGALKLARREMRLDHAVLFGGAVTILF